MNNAIYNKGGRLPSLHVLDALPHVAALEQALAAAAGGARVSLREPGSRKYSNL